MNYCYMIQPRDSYVVLRKCPKCGCKMRFINTNNFRVNANGNQIDVWLIYQCEKCKHTYNLTIYERVKPSTIDRKKYDDFLNNNVTLALKYGKDKTLFDKNRAEIDGNQIHYDMIRLEVNTTKGNIVIKNPYGIKLRLDKVLSELLELSRSNIKKMMDDEEICCEQNKIEVVISFMNGYQFVIK